jgi:uncharacterized protein (TIGR02147 family)
MDKNIFDYHRYIPYLKAKLANPQSRGEKARLAAAVGVQATYVSQILQEKSHLSLEQAEAANAFFKHTTQEAHYFLLLVQKDRAGTKTLREYFQSQLDEILKARLVLTERLGKSNQLAEQDRSWYYASWLPAAVHIATTIPGLRKIESMLQAFRVSESTLLKTLERLEQIGLITKVGNEYHTGQQQVRLGNDSHHVIKHHTNWRLQAMQSLDRESLNELHYSAVVSLSKADVIKIKESLLESIGKNVQVIRDSKEEELFCLTLDFFNLIGE